MGGFVDKQLKNFNNGINVVVVLANQLLASGDIKGQIQIWNSNSGFLIRTLNRGHTNEITALIVLPDGRLVSSSLDEKIIFWDVDTGEKIETIETQMGGVSCMTVFEKGKRLASGSTNATILIWDIWNTHKNLKILKDHKDKVRSLVGFGDKLISSSDDQTIKIWNMISGVLIRTIKENSSVFSLAALPNNRIACGLWNATIQIFDINNGILIHSLEDELSWTGEKGHTDSVLSLLLLKDSLTLASASKDKTVRLWNIESGSLIKTLYQHNDCVNSLSLLNDGRLVSGSRDKSIIIWKNVTII